MDDFISREDTIDKMQEVDWYHQNKNGEMVHGANSSEHQAWYKAEDVYKVLEDMPPAQPDLIAKIQNGINTTNANDSYSCGMRNGMRWCMSLVDGKEPLFENCPSVQPERKKGKWIPVTKIYKVTEDQFPKTHIEWVDATEPDEIDAVKCSVCGEVFDFADARNWCTQCGAKIDKRKGADDVSDE